MAVCSSWISWFKIGPEPTLLDLLIKNWWVLLILVVFFFYLINRVNLIKAKEDALKKINRFLLFVLFIVVLVFIISFLLTYFLPCQIGGELTNKILNENITENENEYYFGYQKSSEMYFAETFVLLPLGIFESNKYIFSCVSNAEVSSVPDSFFDFFLEAKNPFSGEPKCNSFAEGNKIINKTDEKYFILFYQCKPSKTINVIIQPEYTFFEPILKKEILCEYLVN